MTSGVVVAYLHRDDHQLPAFGVCMNSLLLWDARTTRRVTDHGDLITLASGPRIASSRNAVVDAFLALDAEWLWLVDDDMVFPADVLDRYMEHADAVKVPILGGLAFAVGHGGRLTPTLYRKTEDDIEPVWNYPPDALCKVDATGAACLLVHRTVLTAMLVKYHQDAYPFFKEVSEPRADGSYKELGEDVVFCLRARQLGFPVHVHTGILVEHGKPKLWGQSDYAAFGRRMSELGSEEAVQAEHLAKMGITGERVSVS